VQGRLKRLAEAEHARAAELNAVIRAMGDGVIVCGADGRTILANPAGRAMFPDAAEVGYTGILAALRDPEGTAPRLGTHAGPVVFRTKAEPERWIEVATYPVDRSADGETHGETILVLRDVTEQRQREAVRETFIGVLSHELRTPVTTIYAGSKVLARGSGRLDEELQRSVFEDIHIEAERLHRLVEDVIALTRFGEEEGDVGNEPVLLQRVLPTVVRSHELRTPVTTIFGGARVLSRDESGLDESTRREILNDVAEEAERLKRLVEDVVALSRFGETDADLGREPVLLQRVVPAVVASEEERWPGVDFEVTIPPGLPTVFADPTYLEQVIRNLLANAAKYGGQGASVEIAVEADLDAEEVLVCVRDDGPGILSHEAERLFDLFYRSPNTASATTGAGIGLFVCARLIRAMGGRIWAQNRDGRGAEFGFALRVMDDE
jgi:K+-sensing histidine kinase KdpD